MTDNEIIKALEYCESDEEDEMNICGLALDLINSQKAEIERLEKEIEKQEAILEAIDAEMFSLPFEADFDKAIKTAKIEAIKEFAERLKMNSYSYRATNGVEEVVVDISVIDDIIREITKSEEKINA